MPEPQLQPDRSATNPSSLSLRSCAGAASPRVCWRPLPCRHRLKNRPRGYLCIQVRSGSSGDRGQHRKRGFRAVPGHAAERWCEWPVPEACAGEPAPVRRICLRCLCSNVGPQTPSRRDAALLRTCRKHRLRTVPCRFRRMSPSLRASGP